MKHESIFDIWTARATMHAAIAAAREEGLEPDEQAIAGLFGAPEQAMLRRLLQSRWKDGVRAAAQEDLRGRARAVLMASHEGSDLLSDAAFLVGLAGDELTVLNLVREYIALSAC